MKRSVLAWGVLMAAAASGARAQQTDPVGEIRKSFGTVSEWITKAADAVPADKYSYRPVATVRSFGQLVAHIVDEYNYWCAQAGGKKVEWSDATEKGPTDKATVVSKLRAATAACTSGHSPGASVQALLANNADAYLHYGNIATYLRMMGMVPPSSQ